MPASSRPSMVAADLLVALCVASAPRMLYPLSHAKHIQTFAVFTTSRPCLLQPSARSSKYIACHRSPEISCHGTNFIPMGAQVCTMGMAKLALVSKQVSWHHACMT